VRLAGFVAGGLSFLIGFFGGFLAVGVGDTVAALGALIRRLGVGFRTGALRRRNALFKHYLIEGLVVGRGHVGAQLEEFVLNPTKVAGLQLRPCPADSTKGRIGPGRERREVGWRVAEQGEQVAHGLAQLLQEGLSHVARFGPLHGGLYHFRNGLVGQRIEHGAAALELLGQVVLGGG
jgi:hypothetical protein